MVNATLRDLFKALKFKQNGERTVLDSVRSNKFITNDGALRNEFGSSGKFAGSSGDTLQYNGKLVSTKSANQYMVLAGESIQAVIDEGVESRDSINEQILVNVASGKFVEDIDLPQNCQIVGNGTIITGDITTSVEDTSNSDVIFSTLRNLIIEGTITHDNVDGALQLEVNDCILVNLENPIFASSGTPATTAVLTHNVSFIDSQFYGLAGSSMINSDAGYKHLFRDCEFYDGTIDIAVGDVLIKGCSFDVQDGISLGGTAKIYNSNIDVSIGSALLINDCDVFNTSITMGDATNFASLYPTIINGNMRYGGLFISTNATAQVGAGINVEKYNEGSNFSGGAV